jgi:hypothetical protein
MRQLGAASATFLVLLATSSATAQSALDSAPVPTLLAAEAALERIDAFCGITFDTRQEVRSQSGACRADRALLDALAAWVSAELDLPQIIDMPEVKLASPRELVLVRIGRAQHQTLASSAVDSGAATPHHQHEIVALYEDATRTIYLQEGWSGATSAELSILVHEMTHHVQNLAGLRYECAEAREKLAYMAQAQWLALFGQTLAGEFSTDPMTLLVRTVCPR